MKSSVLKKIIICAVSAVTVAFTAVSASACSIETIFFVILVSAGKPIGCFIIVDNGVIVEVFFCKFDKMPYGMGIHISVKRIFYFVTFSVEVISYLYFGVELDSHSKEEAYYKLHLTPSVYKNRGYDDKQNETVKEEDALQTVMLVTLTDLIIMGVLGTLKVTEIPLSFSLSFEKVSRLSTRTSVAV